MLHNVVMKVTFERVGGGEKAKGADDSPFQIMDNSGFTPADDIVASLETNGHSVLIERTLNAANFQAIFLNIFPTNLSPIRTSLAIPVRFWRRPVALLLNL